jgi:hypothetical protein
MAVVSSRLIVWLTFALLSAESFFAQDQKTPRFEDYPVQEAFSGKPAPVKLDHPSERLFRTRLIEASRQAPNFAGHFVFAGWGCGSQCAAGAFVDLHTGKILPTPMRLGETDWDRWNYCGMPAGKQIEFRVDSRLVKFRCGLEGGEYSPDVDYFALVDGEFREILHVPGTPHWREYTKSRR